jgi:O-antigen ligase
VNRRVRTDRSLGWITDLALYGSIALVLARGMMHEILREPMQVQIGQEPAPIGPGPATGLILDALCCVPALLIVLRSALDRGWPIRWTLTHTILFLLGTWTLLSAVWSSDKFASAISAAHFAAGLVVLWTFSQLVRDWRSVRLVAGSALGLLIVITVHGLLYRYLDLPDLVRSVERDWATILQERGWEPGSFMATQFKKRIVSGEIMGFSASPNTYGALLVMLGVVGAGLLVQRICDRDEYGWAVAIGVALSGAAWALCFTGSRAAFGGAALGGIILLFTWTSGSWRTSHRKLAFWGCTAFILICIGLIVGHGLWHGTLFHDSLTFRWKYWVGGWRVFVDNPIVGVGFANFGLWYLGSRLPEAAEEISDPHNLFVRMFVELGMVGGAILVALLVRLWWDLTRPHLPPDAEEPPGQSQSSHRAMGPLFWLAGAATLIAILAAIDFTQSGAYIFIEVLKRLLYATLLLLGLAVATLRSSTRPQPDWRPAAWVLYAMLAATGVFLIQNLVDFSMFENGAMFSFMMIAGTTLGARMGENWRVSGRVASIALVVASAIWFCFLVGMVVPVALAERAALRGDQELRSGAPAAAAMSYQSAFRSLWLPNADYAFRAARAMVLAGSPADDVRAMIRTAIAASPMTARSHHLLAEFELRQVAPDPMPAIAAFERVLVLDPMDISTRLDLARALESAGREGAARAQYQQALRLNDLLNPDEPERLPPAQVDRIRAAIARLSDPD